MTRRGAALQEAIGESAGRGADVERMHAGHVDAERLERCFELFAAAADESARRFDGDLVVVANALAGLCRPARRLRARALP